MMTKYLGLILCFCLSSSWACATNDKNQYELITDSELTGRLWLPHSTTSGPGILLIGGSGGGYENQDAKWLSLAGFVVLNVRYFGVKGLPEHLVKVPVEYFSKAINWLGQHPAVKDNKIGIFGHSRGTEAAVLTARHNPSVAAVVLRSTSAVVWAGPGWEGYNESAWTWDKKPIAFMNVGLVDGGIWLSRVLRKKTHIKTSEMFESALEDNDSVNEALLPIEHINAHLLILSGADDQQWPSAPMAQILITKLQKLKVDFNFKHIAFANAGHRPGHLSEPDDTFANGGTVEGNTQAHEQTKVLVKAFFNKALTSP